MKNEDLQPCSQLKVNKPTYLHIISRECRIIQMPFFIHASISSFGQGKNLFGPLKIIFFEYPKVFIIRDLTISWVIKSFIMFIILTLSLRA